MELQPINNSPNFGQTTAFTSILVGVFLNDHTINISGLSEITESLVYHRYGPPLLQSLQVFSEYSALEQVYVIHCLKR